MLVGLGVVLLIVTSALGALAISLYRKSQKLLSTGVQVPGVVVDLVKYPGKNRGMPTTAAIFEFKCDDGSTRRCESGVRSYPARHKVGDNVRVMYLRGTESEATILDFQELWLGPILIGVLALGALLFALVCLWAARGAVSS